MVAAIHTLGELVDWHRETMRPFAMTAKNGAGGNRTPVQGRKPPKNRPMLKRTQRQAQRRAPQTHHWTQYCGD